MQTQLRMIRRNLDDLPEVELTSGYEIRTYRPGDEAAWAKIMNSGIGADWTAEKCSEALISKSQFLPDGLFFAVHDDEPVGSACAWRSSPDEWNEGYLHMVCVLPEHRGKNVGYLLALSVLHYFREHKFQSCILDTDEWRIPAIKSYLRLGFEPMYLDESQRERWQKVFEHV